MVGRYTKFICIKRDEPVLGGVDVHVLDELMKYLARDLMRCRTDNFWQFKKCLLVLLCQSG